jgi:hypothetical protein
VRERGFVSVLFLLQPNTHTHRCTEKNQRSKRGREEMRREFFLAESFKKNKRLLEAFFLLFLLIIGRDIQRNREMKNL